MILGREDQHSYLVAALEGHLPQSLLIWGPPSSGKTLVFEAALSQCNIPHVARISAIEVMCGRRPFFETLLKQLSDDKEFTKCENLRVFIRQLRRIHQQRDGSEKTVIILEEADYLRDEHAEILEVFSRLQELIQSNLCVIIFSSIVTSLGFVGICNLRSIPSIHFPQYSKEQVVNIIATSHRPPNSDFELFSAYVGMVVNVFYQCCRDIKKLLRLTLSNWKSVELRQNANQHNQNLHSLWKDVVPQLREDFKALNSPFLPMADTSGKRKGQSSSSSKVTSRSLSPVNYAKTSGSSTHSSSRSYDDIPKYSRYILIASYLATHNPPSSDKRFFVKGSTRKTGKKGNKISIRAELEENENERTKALRSFEQNRLKSIFAFLVTYCSNGTETYEGSADWFMQISSLCQSQFIQRIGEDTSGNMKYRCLADYDFIVAVANSVDFELDKHLYRLL